MRVVREKESYAAISFHLALGEDHSRAVCDELYRNLRVSETDLLGSMSETSRWNRVLLRTLEARSGLAHGCFLFCNQKITDILEEKS